MENINNINQNVRNISYELKEEIIHSFKASNSIILDAIFWPLFYLFQIVLYLVLGHIVPYVGFVFFIAVGFLIFRLIKVFKNITCAKKVKLNLHNTYITGYIKVSFAKIKPIAFRYEDIETISYKKNKPLKIKLKEIQKEITIYIKNSEECNNFINEKLVALSNHRTIYNFTLDQKSSKDFYYSNIINLSKESQTQNFNKKKKSIIKALCKRQTKGRIAYITVNKLLTVIFTLLLNLVALLTIIAVSYFSESNMINKYIIPLAFSTCIFSLLILTFSKNKLWNLILYVLYFTYSVSIALIGLVMLMIYDMTLDVVFVLGLMYICIGLIIPVMLFIAMIISACIWKKKKIKYVHSYLICLHILRSKNIISTKDYLKIYKTI